jgi:transcriptional regulator with XRE-family HTH domain
MLYLTAVKHAEPVSRHDRRMHWGKRLRDERERLERTGQDVAKAAGVTKGAVSQWENGGNIRPENLFAIADYLGISARWLATGKGSRHPKAELNDPENAIVTAFRALPPAYQGMLLADVDKYATAARQVLVDSDDIPQIPH